MFSLPSVDESLEWVNAQARKRGVRSPTYLAYWLLFAAIVSAFGWIPLLLGASVEWPSFAKTIIITLNIGVFLYLFSFVLGEDLLGTIVFTLNSAAQICDKFLNLNYYKDGWFNRLNLIGHSWKASVLAALFLTTILFGPQFNRGAELAGFNSIGVFLSVMVALVVIALLNKLSRKFANGSSRGYRLQFVPQWITNCFLILIIVFLITDAETRAADSPIYLHIVILLVGILLVMLLLAYFLAWLLFKRYIARLSGTYEQSDNSEVQASGNPKISGNENNAHSIKGSDLNALKMNTPKKSTNLGIDHLRFARSLIKAPVYHLIEILWFPSIFVLLIAEHDAMVRWAFYAGVSWWVVYAVAEMHAHLGHILIGLRRMLFHGGQTIISLTVILLAGGRLFDNSYIATIVESQGSNLTLLGYICSGYIVFWYYEYWVNRILCDRLMCIFKDVCTNHRISVKYVDRNNSGSTHCGVLQIHGGSRFALLDENEEFLESIGRVDLLNRLLNDEPSKKTDREDDSLLDGRQLKLVLVGRLRSYFTILGLVLAVAIGSTAYAYYSLPQRAEVIANPPMSKEPPLFNLQQAIFGHSDNSDTDPCSQEAKKAVILLAASGGGTRAALYTYSVLRGLRQIKMGDDCSALNRVVLLSGVSGGSAALAYFKMNQDLLKTPPSDEPCIPDIEDNNSWCKFRVAMSRAFIKDVLIGASEMRMLYGCKKPTYTEGLRLGSLLRESMDRGLGSNLFGKGCSPIDTSIPQGEGRFLIGDEETGLIFNTTLAGQLPFPSTQDNTLENGCPGPLTNTPINSLQENELKKACLTSFGKGGRLVLTNLRNARNLFSLATQATVTASSSNLNYEIIDDPLVPLATAAALSANFPPVFPNSAIERKDLARYWVTDGGAADNRGIISLLYALKGTLELPPEEVPENKAKSWSDIHVVLVDASATTLVYSQDRGVSSALGSAERFASQLMADNLDDIDGTYKAKANKGIKFHDLTMPIVLRSGGGIGTHWMLPESILLRPPFGTNQDALKSVDPCVGNKDSLSPWDSIWRFYHTLTTPGCEVDKEEILTLFDLLHTVGNEEAFEPLIKLNESKPNVLRWLCEKPLNNTERHAENWQKLIYALAPVDEYTNYCNLHDTTTFK